MTRARTLVATGFVAGLAYFAAAEAFEKPADLDAPSTPQCHPTDGDTLKCDGTRYRLDGIDAPEMPGRCRRGRRCAPGDPFQSAEMLGLGLQMGPVTLIRVGTDPYGNPVARARAGIHDLSCWQLRYGVAIYRADWDETGTLPQDCAAE